VTPPEPQALLRPTPTSTPKDVSGSTLKQIKVSGDSIATVTIDKNEVCVGEENLIRVNLHPGHPQGRVFVNGELGSVRKQIALPNMVGQVTPTISFIHSTAEETTPIQAPFYVVKPCKTQVFGQVNHQLLVNSRDVFGFVVKIVSHPNAIEFMPTGFRWDFGDGTEVTTMKPYVEHDFSRRPQTTDYSEFLVRVDVQDHKGKVLTLHEPMVLQNDAFQHQKQRNTILLLSNKEPRLAEVLTDGSVRQSVQLWHTHDKTVRIQRVIVEIEDEKGSTKRSQGNPSELLDSLSLSPGKSVHANLRLAKDSPARLVRYEISGISEDGKLAEGTFSIQRPTAKPTPENHSPVDARTAMRIRMAQKILGKPFVSDGDMDRLEAQGAFRKLEARPD
jgi:hypothetical protein